MKYIINRNSDNADVRKGDKVKIIKIFRPFAFVEIIRTGEKVNVALDAITKEKQ